MGDHFRRIRKKKHNSLVNQNYDILFFINYDLKFKIMTMT